MGGTVGMKDVLLVEEGEKIILKERSSPLLVIIKFLFGIIRCFICACCVVYVMCMCLPIDFIVLYVYPLH